MEPVNVGSPFCITRINANAAGSFEILAAPDRGQSHYLDSVTVNKGSSGDGFNLLRRACAKFTAANNTITVTDAAGLQMATGDFSLELWFRWVTGTLAAVPALAAKISGTEGYLLEMTAAGLAKFTFGDSDESVALTSTRKVGDGHWHHICVTVDRNVKAGFILYVDGRAEAVSTDASQDPTDIEGNVTATGTNLVITGVANVEFHCCGLGVYKGLALTAAQVENRFARSHMGPKQEMSGVSAGTGRKFTGSETSLTCGLNMDEGTGTTAYSAVGTTNGSLANTTWTTDGLPLGRRILQNSVFITAAGSMAQLCFDPPLEIGRGNPLRTLETDGSFEAMFIGHTGHTG